MKEALNIAEFMLHEQVTESVPAENWTKDVEGHNSTESSSSSTFSPSYPEGASADKERPINPCLWRIMLLSGALLYGSYAVLVHLSQIDGQIPFSSASSVLVSEFLKLTISMTMFLPEVYSKGFVMPSWKFALPFCIPATLYCLNNNLAVHMQMEMDPATYQVLCNLKIPSTAILYRIIMKKPITGIQWLALALLAIAGASNSYGSLQSKPGTNSAGINHITVKGIIMICTYATVSGLSGVTNEYVMKKKFETSLHLQNSILYLFGIILNGATFITGVLSQSSPAVSWNLFKGYTVFTWIIVLNQAVVGLLLSAVMKHGNNITRLFIISCAMLVTTVLSVLIFHLHLNVYYCSSFVIVVLALYLYHRN